MTDLLSVSNAIAAWATVGVTWYLTSRLVSNDDRREVRAEAEITKARVRNKLRPAMRDRAELQRAIHALAVTNGIHPEIVFPVYGELFATIDEVSYIDKSMQLDPELFESTYWEAYQGREMRRR